MKYWIIRIPDTMPFGLTFLLAIMRAIVLASFVKVSFGGKVETVWTSLTQYLRDLLAVMRLALHVRVAIGLSIRSPDTGTQEQGRGRNEPKSAPSNLARLAKVRHNLTVVQAKCQRPGRAPRRSDREPTTPEVQAITYFRAAHSSAVAAPKRRVASMHARLDRYGNFLATYEIGA
jgi:hypothetical protein